MAENLDRRHLSKKSVIVSAGATLGLSLEEKILRSRDVAKTSASERQTSGDNLPAANILFIVWAYIPI